MPSLLPLPRPLLPLPRPAPSNSNVRSIGDSLQGPACCRVCRSCSLLLPNRPCPRLLSTDGAAMNMIDNVLASKPAASLAPYSAKFEGDRSENAPANKFPAGWCSLRMRARSGLEHSVWQRPAMHSLFAACTFAPRWQTANEWLRE